MTEGTAHRCFFEIGVLKKFAIFTGKHWYWSFFLITLQALRRVYTHLYIQSMVYVLIYIIIYTFNTKKALFIY